MISVFLNFKFQVQVHDVLLIKIQKETYQAAELSDEAKKLLGQRIPMNTRRASSTPLIRLCIFIVQRQGLITDTPKDLCDKFNIRTEERFGLLDYIHKQCRCILFPDVLWNQQKHLPNHNKGIYGIILLMFFLT